MNDELTKPAREAATRRDTLRPQLQRAQHTEEVAELQAQIARLSRRLTERELESAERILTLERELSDARADAALLQGVIRRLPSTLPKASAASHDLRELASERDPFRLNGAMLTQNYSRYWDEAWGRLAVPKKVEIGKHLRSLGVEERSMP